jgi:hypothetical protein
MQTRLHAVGPICENPRTDNRERLGLALESFMGASSSRVPAR